ncbi:C4-dicarboxylate ABC transporter substrate-binding protein, partial [Halomonas sp. KAO]|nr:C4-dicarboxylate ABC transporter substrate-binding protein [Halomonas sp. KAO]
AQARQLNAAPGLPPAHPSHTPLYTEFSKLLSENTEGRLTAKIFGPEVTSVSNMRAALRNKIVDVGFFLPSYFPADLPNINLVADLAVLGDNSLVMSSAMAEYVTTCIDCQDE